MYQPTKELLEAIRPRLTKGGILAFDELAHPKWPGETAPAPGREPTVIYMKWGEWRNPVGATGLRPSLSRHRP